MPQNLFVADQLSDGVITDVKVASDAGIQFSKLEKMPLAADGSVIATANIDLGNNKIVNLEPGTATGDAVEFDQMNAAIAAAGAASEWYDSAIDRRADPPSSPNAGDRYLIIATASGDWTGKEDQVATWDGSQWTYQVPTTGTYISVDDETDGFYYYGGSSWERKSFEVTTASHGLVKVGNDIQIDPNAIGDGLEIDTTSGELKVSLTSLGGLEFDGTSPDKTISVKVDANGAIDIDSTSGGLKLINDASASGSAVDAINIAAAGVSIKVDNSTIVGDGSGNLKVGIIDSSHMSGLGNSGEVYMGNGSTIVSAKLRKYQTLGSSFSSTAPGGTLTLPDTPIGPVFFFYNGGLMNEGTTSGDDYERSGADITLRRGIGSSRIVEFMYWA